MLNLILIIPIAMCLIHPGLVMEFVMRGLGGKSTLQLVVGTVEIVLFLGIPIAMCLIHPGLVMVFVMKYTTLQLVVGTVEIA